MDKDGVLAKVCWSFYVRKMSTWLHCLRYYD